MDSSIGIVSGKFEVNIPKDIKFISWLKVSISQNEYFFTVFSINHGIINELINGI